MEHLTEKEKSDFTQGMRAASSQGERTFKKVAVLRSLSADIPAGTRINGEDVDKLIDELESRGIILPTTGISAVEVRNLRGKVVDVMPKVSLRGIPIRGKTTGSTPATYDSSDSLKTRGKMQEQMFLLELAKSGDTIEALEARIEEERDPLMKLVRKRQGK